jgi:hypothetical protein
MCPTCHHPLDSHGSHGNCLFPNCECGHGQKIELNFHVHMAPDGVSTWIIQAHCIELNINFEFSVKAETENEALWNATRTLRTLRIKRLDG